MLLDEYERRARFIPGLWVVAPIAVAIISLGLRQNPVVVFVVGALSAFGAPIVLAGYVRQRGREVEEHLFKEWGGAPTTMMLRHSGLAAGSVERTNLRSHLAGQLSFAFPTEAEERANPEAADCAYDEAVKLLRARTRDKKKFPLLFIENKNYGYERNLLGLRSLGITVSASSLVTLAVASLLLGLWKLPTLPDVAIGALLILAIVVFWLRVPQPGRVKRIATTYAERLFEASLGLTGA